MGRIAPSNFKPVSRTTNADACAICWVRFNSGRKPIPTNEAGAEVTSADFEVTANLIDFDINTVADTIVGTYTNNSGTDSQAVLGDTNCATVAELLAVINGTAPGQTTAVRRWRAGLGDFRPQHVLGTGDLIVVAADTNLMLGRNHEGVAVMADTSAMASADVVSAGLGEPRCFEGGGQSIPDHFETGYTSTTAGVRTPVRSAGLDTENQPGLANMQVYVTDIQCGMAHATTKVVTAYDNLGNTLKAEAVTITAGGTIAGSGNYSFENPWVVGPPGSPVWVEVTGTGGVTTGALTVSGFIRVS